VRFELTEPVSSSDFKSDAIDHSAISPIKQVQSFFILFYLLKFIITPFDSKNNFERSSGSPLTLKLILKSVRILKSI
jgi:hypothetical protein